MDSSLVFLDGAVNCLSEGNAVRSAAEVGWGRKDDWLGSVCGRILVPDDRVVGRFEVEEARLAEREMRESCPQVRFDRVLEGGKVVESRRRDAVGVTSVGFLVVRSLIHKRSDGPMVSGGREGEV